MASRVRVGSCIVLLGFGATLGAGCGSDDADGAAAAGSGGGGTGGGGGQAGAATGGAGAGGEAGSGQAGSGGSGGSGGAVDAGLVTPCMQNQTDPDPGGTAALDAECCGGLGKCTDVASIPADQLAALGSADCVKDPGVRCAPAVSQIPPSCRAIGDIEGRCIPACFLLGNKSAGNLQQGSCDTDLKCAPCYSPLDGSDTGACTQNGDAPVEPAPSPYAACGAGDAGGADGGTAGGVCVPVDAIPPNFAGALLQHECPADFLCAPRNRVEDPSLCFAPCESIAGLGACVPKFLVPTDFHNLLQQSTCADGELCAPCTNPLEAGASTGACD